MDDNARVVDVKGRADISEALLVLAGSALMEGDRDSWVILMGSSHRIRALDKPLKARPRW